MQKLRSGFVEELAWTGKGKTTAQFGCSGQFFFIYFII